MDENFTRRVHTLFAIFLFMLGLLAGMKQYFGNPILCWMPSHFTGSMTWYGNSFCYFSKSFYLFNNTTPFKPDPSRKETNFYKWTPFLFVFIAVVCKLPCICIHFGRKMFAVNLQNFINLSTQASRPSKESREFAIQQLTVELDIRISDRVQNLKGSRFRRCVDIICPSLSVHTQLQQLLCKFTYAVCSVFIVVFLCSFLKPDLNLSDSLTSQSTAPKNNTLFPKVFFCEFEILRLTNIQQYVVQCHVASNELFEKMALLVCYVALVVSSVSCGDLVCSLVTNPFNLKGYCYVKKHMKKFAELHSGYDREMAKAFCEHYLKEDGMYLIQMIGQNSSGLVAGLILERLWQNYKKNLFRAKPNLSDDITTKLPLESVLLASNIW